MNGDYGHIKNNIRELYDSWRGNLAVGPSKMKELSAGKC